MAYDIPDEIKYREKIVANLDLKQLGYVILFAILGYLSYVKSPIEGDLRFAIPGMIITVGLGFIFLNLEEKIKDVISYYTNIRKANYNSKAAQKFFEVREIKDDVVYLEDKKILAILQVFPINFELLDESRKKALLVNYKAFLNQLTVPIQILIRTKPVKLNHYFQKIEVRKDKRALITDLYSDFKVFEQDFLDNNSIKERFYYIIIPFKKSKTLLGKGDNQELKQLNEFVKITEEKLTGCGLQCHRLTNQEILDLCLSYADIGGEIEIEETELKKDERSQDIFRNMLTPSFDVRKNYAIVNSEFHRIVKVTGYPRKVEDGWLQAFLSKNENYDISIHITPHTIQSMLVYLHNQIIQQTSDLFMSTAKGTPNPSLEIKKADTMRVYDSLYKGEEKMFAVSLYVDNKAERLDELNLLTEKCKSNLNAQLMIPRITEWRMADGIKSTLPLANDKLKSYRDFLTNSLAATFPFISPLDTKKDGILFAHEADTLNPIFIDFDSMSNKHFFVIGISGSGKSYTSKYLIMQQLFKEDSKIYILDPNGEYSALCQSLDGHVVELSRDSESIINIFDLAGDDFGNKMLSLISAFDIIVGGLTESQKAVLSKVLIKTYERKKIFYDKPESWSRKPPTFSDVKKVLSKLRKEYAKRKEYIQDTSFEVLLSRVEMYCKKGIFGFLDKISRIDVEKNFVCFDLSQLPNAVKNLMMFATLEMIQKEIKKDKKAKVVLIDEGWSLLRSKEAANYILDFIKTSRKFNTSLGFITQEIEDLLGSKTGRSILNTASMKILMRQNPSNIDVIAAALHLNEHAKNYLLTILNGYGLIITDKNTYKFFVKASDKIHELITTAPLEFKQKIKKPDKKPEKIKIKNKKGLYLRKELNEKQLEYFLANGYIEHKDRLTQSGGSCWFVLKPRHNESTEHAFLCWSTYYLLKEHFKNVKLSTTKPGDITVKINKNTKIIFEIETGTSYQRHSKEELEKKFEDIRKQCNELYIVVTTWPERRHYERFGTVITRTQIIDAVNKLVGKDNIKDLTTKRIRLN